MMTMTMTMATVTIKTVMTMRCVVQWVPPYPFVRRGAGRGIG